jgi:hypothetical protein
MRTALRVVVLSELLAVPLSDSRLQEARETILEYIADEEPNTLAGHIWALSVRFPFLPLPPTRCVLVLSRVQKSSSRFSVPPQIVGIYTSPKPVPSELGFAASSS